MSDVITRYGNFETKSLENSYVDKNITEKEGKEKIDPSELQNELKTRMKLLEQLENEGKRTKDISELKLALKETINELDQIIESIS